MLPEHLTNDRDVLERFKREAKAVALMRWRGRVGEPKQKDCWGSWGSGPSDIDPFWFGVVHAGLGEFDRAMDDLERAADDQSFHMLMSYPSVDPLRTHPRFVALMVRMGLPADPRQPA